MPEDFEQIRTFNPTKAILVLVQSLKAGINFRDIASLLNAHYLLTATGKAWSADHVKGLLSRLRRNSVSPTAIYKDVLRLINAGIITSADAALLLMPQKRGRKVSY
ncbi:hypothetical protein [Herbaspirillum huttiense]|uniref:hypothetical protein n=1 Tax=Herbaspirillum huttiense TaxID=863372 RepID=UPI0039AF7C2F